LIHGKFVAKTAVKYLAPCKSLNLRDIYPTLLADKRPLMMKPPKRLSTEFAYIPPLPHLNRPTL
jgi:hypothetical protein